MRSEPGVLPKLPTFAAHTFRRQTPGQIVRLKGVRLEGVRVAGDRGIALVAVVVVLLALIAIATPFSLSMRNQARTAEVQTTQALAEKSVATALSMAEKQLAQTDPEVDPTPYADDERELLVDLADLAENFATDPSDPRGSIWSARAEDEQGKVDVNKAAPTLLGNLLGATMLRQELEGGESLEVAVESTRGFPDEGVVWIEGELILYRNKTEVAFTDVTRGATTSVLFSRPPATHSMGAVVIDYRAILVAVFPYKVSELPGEFVGFPGVRAIKQIGDFGEVSIAADLLDGIEGDLTAYAVRRGQAFGGGARLVLPPQVDDKGPYLVVQGGRNLGAGTVVRIRDDGFEDVEYNLVATAQEVGADRFRLNLQEPVTGNFDPDESVVEGLIRAPVNINTCSPRVLEALLRGVRIGTFSAIDARKAKAIADKVLKARPIQGEPALAEILRGMEESGELNKANREFDAILTNASYAGDVDLGFGTAPFSYTTEGVVVIEAAASENLPLGREASRLFARTTVEVRPPGERLTLFATQTDFHDAARLSRTGRYWTTYPNDLLDFDRYNQPPQPVRSYVDWKRYPSMETVEEAFAKLAPVRIDGYRGPEALGSKRVIHFDEPQQGDRPWDSDNQDGWETGERGVISLPVGGFPVDMLDQRGYPRPLAISGWFTFQGGSGEAVLFDTGEEDVRNRIFTTFDGTALTFHVADASLPDIGSGGGPLQMAQIRYKFDDGLTFEQDVAYHFTFYARGTKPSDLALFVDGTPRGERAFQTRLASQLSAAAGPSPFSNIPGYNPGANATIAVENAEDFPPQGVVRIGNELIEYTSRSAAALIVQPQQSNPFGGRSQRGSNTQSHDESEAVELYGYAAALTSERIPTGFLGLNDKIGEFGVAMVDPSSSETVGKPILINLQQNGVTAPQAPTNFPIGLGMDETVTSIPLKILAKPSPTGGAGGGGADYFNKGGGFALIVSSPRPPPSNAADIQVPVPIPGGPQEQLDFGWNRPLIATSSAYVGMGEVVRYSSFDGNALNGVTRSGPGFIGSTGPWKPYSNLEETSGGAPIDEFATRGHVHIFQWQVPLGNQGSNHDSYQPIFVVPISVGAGSNVAESFAVPVPLGGGGSGSAGGGTGGTGAATGTLPEMVQIGTGWGGTGGSGAGTEWVRYDSMSGGHFVRDNPARLRAASFMLGRILTQKYTAKNGSPPAATGVAEALNFELIAATSNYVEDIAKAGGVDPATLTSSVAGGGILAFRGVLGTGTRAHPSGDTVLPVFRTQRTGEIYSGRPGTTDWVTIVDPDTGSNEGHRINYGYCLPDVEGWGGAACHVAFEDGVAGDYFSNLSQLFSGVDPKDPNAGVNALMNANVESRDIVRLLKFPSGELPTKVGEELNIGGDLHGATSPRDVIIDELEFFGPTTPAVSLPRHPRYLLSRDDDGSGQLYVAASALRYNMWTRSGTVMEAINPVNNLPEDGFVLLLDDELIAITRYDILDQEATMEVAVNGRGYLGTPIQSHPAGTAARELTFLRVSRLEDSINPDDNILQIANDQDFDERGVVQVGRELIGYDRKENGELFMPLWTDETDEEVGIWRGSYGTIPNAHDQGALVYQFPVRHLDRYRPNADIPELGYLELQVNARDAFFNELSWVADGERELVDLVVEARVGGRGSFAEDPADSPDVFLFDQQAAKSNAMSLLRQGDRLELRVFTRFKPGAFDAKVFDPDPGDFKGGSNDWKIAPQLKALGVRWIGRSVRVEYEEWR